MLPVNMDPFLPVQLKSPPANRQSAWRAQGPSAERIVARFINQRRVRTGFDTDGEKNHTELIEEPEGDVVLPNALTVLSTTAMKTSFEALAPAFEREAGYRLAVAFGPSSQLEKRLAEGEAADVAIVTHAGAQDFIARGGGIAGSLADLVRSFIGVCVAKGAPRPDLSSGEAVRNAML